MAWHIATDQLLEVHGLHDPTTGLFVEQATVRAVMVDDTGVQVGGQSWPLVLGFVPGSDGNYRAVLESTRQLEEGATYSLEIVAVVGGTLVKEWRLNDVARHRTPSDG